jgi:elongation factor P--(R)-beta-lysine ligase
MSGEDPRGREAAGGAAPPGRQAALALRSRVLRAIREFFHARDFVEVETPVRLRAPALELHIDAETSGDRFLRTSPELHMKRLLAAGMERIWQMGPCFRRGERGDRHHPEYTMLEWYRARADYRDILADTRDLLLAVAKEALGRTMVNYRGCTVRLDAPWTVLTVSDAFVRWADWDPAAAWDEERFDLDLVDKVELSLPRETPVVLIDYPAAAAALARRRADDPCVAERWELYAGGLELANAYSELTDAAEQRARFADCAAARKARGKPVYPLDEEFLAALPNMPPSGGIALGVDRLVMFLADARTLDDVMAFRE